jgi:hypothetical protein
MKYKSTRVPLTGNKEYEDTNDGKATRRRHGMTARNWLGGGSYIPMARDKKGTPSI